MGWTHFLSEAVFADAVTLDAATAYAYAISSRERARLRESVLHDRAAACRSNAGAAPQTQTQPARRFASLPPPDLEGPSSPNALAKACRDRAGVSHERCANCEG